MILNRSEQIVSIRTTSQSIKDFEKLQIRIMKTGSELEMVRKYLEKSFGSHVTVDTLLKVARWLCDKFKLDIDRLATRNRKALFCWYTENWKIIRNFIRKDGYKSRNPKINFPKFENPYDMNYVDITNISTLLNYK